MPNSLNKQGHYTFSLIMPVYYEGARTIPVITTLAYTVRYPFELIVVYDRDDDPTIATADNLSKDFQNMRLVKNEDDTGGVINAIKTGIRHCSSDIVSVWCAYHVDPYGLLNQMYEMIESGCDVVSANRFAEVGRFNRGGLLKKILSRGGNFILWKLAGSQFGDTTTSIKMYRKSFLDANPIQTHSAGGWSLSTELAIKAGANGYKLGEVILNPYNINLISGLSNFNVFGSLPYYVKWVRYGIRNRGKMLQNRIIMQEHARVE